jgi:hypothetical protein
MPLLDLFWTTLLVFGWILWFMLLFRVYGDVFTRRDIGGWAKAAWVVFTLLMPFLGVFVYLISQGRGMAERAALAVAQRQQATDAYIRSVVADQGGQQGATSPATAPAPRQGGVVPHADHQPTVPSART